MHEKNCTPEVRETTSASITDAEVRELFSNFLMPELDKLKKLFPSLDNYGIAVFARTRCFVTQPRTVTGAIPICPDGKDIFELWSKVVDYAISQGLEASSFPRKSTPYRFSFNIHYSKK